VPVAVMVAGFSRKTNNNMNRQTIHGIILLLIDCFFLIVVIASIGIFLWLLVELILTVRKLGKNK